MNIKDIEYLWKRASNNPHHDTNWHDPVVIAFAESVAAHTLMNIDPSSFMSHQEGIEAGRLAEREECAKVCEKMWHRWLDSPEENEPNKPDAEDCYRAIRARGQA
jgi:hypothetical protein